MSAGARGVSAAQDPKFLNKERKLLKTLKFPKEYDQKVDLTRVNWEVRLTPATLKSRSKRLFQSCQACRLITA
jgi:uncharacterized protein YigA (DUF484 family)